jgi:hypothetical protein
LVRPDRMCLPVLLLSFVAAVLLPVSDIEAAQSPAQVPVAGQEEADAEGEAETRNEIALIVAGTYEDLGSEDAENYFTIGAKYQREISSLIAVAGVFEYLNTKPAAVLVFPVHFRPWKGLDIFAGPGVEFSDEEEDDEDGEDHDAGDEGGNSGDWDATFLIRVGVGYAIEFGERYSLSPSVALDFIGREQALVYGADFSIKF